MIDQQLSISKHTLTHQAIRAGLYHLAGLELRNQEEPTFIHDDCLCRRLPLVLIIPLLKSQIHVSTWKIRVTAFL